MPTKQRHVDIGSVRGRSVLLELGRELRNARAQHGLSQADVARAARTSRSQVGRIEHAEASSASVMELARLLAVVGLELSARAYPAGPPIRDAAHLALLDRLRRAVAPSISWRFEVPIGLPGDNRAWDAVLLAAGRQVAVEAETRPRDVQALLRHLATKARDGAAMGTSAVILLLADTRHNRRLLADYTEVLRTEFPAAGAELMEALREGRPPSRSGILLL